MTLNNTTTIPIYNDSGSRVDSFTVKDKLNYVSGRVSRGEKFYYKGVGVPYSSHTVADKSNLSNDYEIIEDTNIFYAPYGVRKKSFLNKFGVFQEKYQPFFPDFIGSCSVKEGLIVINSMTFERSSVDIIDHVEFDKTNQQSYYIIDYLCNRKGYIDGGGTPSVITNLLEYMVQNDWNFLWDKSSISDVSYDGRVTDLADIFKSNDIKHKLGTVYSIHYSLYCASPTLYYFFLRYNKMSHNGIQSFISNSVEMLERFGVDTQELYITENNESIKNYKHRILKYLIRGKNCAHCACDLFIDSGNKVMNQYIKLAERNLSKIK